jgi:hypothetical protein
MAESAVVMNLEAVNPAQLRNQECSPQQADPTATKQTHEIIAHRSGVEDHSARTVLAEVPDLGPNDGDTVAMEGQSTQTTHYYTNVNRNMVEDLLYESKLVVGDVQNIVTWVYGSSQNTENIGGECDNAVKELVVACSGNITDYDI